jgi:hypothetical protein
LVVLESYFDGSGKSDNPDCYFLTLTGYAAPPVVWPAFEVLWETILQRHHLACFHTQVESCRSNPILVAELLDAIGLSHGFGMTTVGVTLDLKAHRRLFSEYVLPKPGRICAEFCINTLLEQADSISCFFDRKEEFLKEVNPLWEADGVPDWPQLANVKELAPVRQVDFPGIQAADLLAWHVNRNLTRSDYGLDLAVIDSRASGKFKMFGEEELRARYGRCP